MPHDFNEQLKFSESARHEPFWIAVYQRAFPELATWYFNNRDNGAQRAGIDRVLVLHGGKTLTVDEKVRKDDYGDIALEYISNDRTGAIGWMEKDLLIDYLAYAVLPSRKCYVLPWQMLRRAWLHHRDVWIEKARRGLDDFKCVPAKNLAGYTTHSVGVPVEYLLKRVSRACEIDLNTPWKPLSFTRDDGAQQSLDFKGRRAG